jgi:hypothetical protein
MARHIWGVDSASNVTEQLFDYVIKDFGFPNFWGRFLTTVPSASEGMTKNEISFLRNKGVKILPIYSQFNTATGYREGRTAANNAIFNARRLGFPKGTVLFANIEKSLEVNDEWIQGWVEALGTSGYKCGIYNDPVNGGFNQAFYGASKENEQVKSQSMLWSAEPEKGGTRSRNAPRYNPQKPNCGGNVWVWQYGRDIHDCPINTNLADSRILASLW